jgi:glycosyltransferase involved in cell wall biosynthesis
MNYWFKYYTSRGHDVNFFTTDFEHQRKITINEVPQNYILLKSYIRYKKNISIKRLLNHLFVAISFLITANNINKKPEIIIVSYPSIFLCFFAVLFARKNKIKIIVDFRDKWPEIFISNKFLGILIFPLFTIKNYIANNSTTNISISNDYLKWAIKNNYTKSDISITSNNIIPLINIENQNLIPKIYDNKKNINFIFVGTLGSTYDLDTILILDDTFKNLNLNYKILICGDGPEKNNFLKKIKNRVNINFLGWLNDQKLNYYLNISHFGLMLYYPQSPQGWPNKLFEYMAYGLPILNTLKGESEFLIQENNLGLNFNKSNTIEVQKWLLKIDNLSYQRLVNNNINYFSKNFSQIEMNKKLDNLIDIYV